MDDLFLCKHATNSHSKGEIACARELDILRLFFAPGPLLAVVLGHVRQLCRLRLPVFFLLSQVLVTTGAIVASLFAGSLTAMPSSLGSGHLHNFPAPRVHC